MSVPVGGVRRVACFCRQLFVCLVAVAAAFAFSNVAMAQDSGAAGGTPSPAGTGAQRLTPITVEAPATAKPQKGQQKQQRSAAKRSNASSTKPRNTTAVTVDAGYGGSARVNAPQQIISADKTGTKLQDIPANVQIIPRELLTEQGAYTLGQSISNASGVNIGGQDSLGYFDHFLIRDSMRRSIRITSPTAISLAVCRTRSTASNASKSSKVRARRCSAVDRRAAPSISFTTSRCPIFTGGPACKADRSALSRPRTTSPARRRLKD